MPFVFTFILRHRVHMYSTWRPLNTATYRGETQLPEKRDAGGRHYFTESKWRASLGRVQHAACIMQSRKAHTPLHRKVYPRHTGSGLGLVSARSLRDDILGGTPTKRAGKAPNTQLPNRATTSCPPDLRFASEFQYTYCFRLSSAP